MKAGGAGRGGCGCDTIRRVSVADEARGASGEFESVVIVEAIWPPKGAIQD